MPERGDIPLLPGQVVAERLRLSIPSLPNWIEPTVEYLRQRALLAGACQETRSGKLLVALHEAITNALIHGNLGLSSELKEQGDAAFAEAVAQRASDPTLSSRRVDVVTEYDGDVCRWIITDEGDGFDVDAVLTRCMSNDPEVLFASGRGIMMMKSFVDDVRFDLGGRRVILSLGRDSGTEKRKDTRVPMHLAFQVTPMSDDGKLNWTRTYEAVSRNFSETGISLLQEELSQSQRILIGIPRNHEIVYVPAEIKHTHNLGGGGMELGCRFLEPVEAKSLAPASSPAVATQTEAVHTAIAGLFEEQANRLPKHERRVHPRVIFNDRVTIIVDDPAQPLYGYACDLSKGGMAFISQTALQGQITIAFSPKKEQPALKVRCRVVRCGRIQEGFYDIGVSFIGLEVRG